MDIFFDILIVPFVSVVPKKDLLIVLILFSKEKAIIGRKNSFCLLLILGSWTSYPLPVRPIYKICLWLSQKF